MSDRIYKICSQAEWATAQSCGEFSGSPVDVADGFIHFSAAHQVVATAAKHFANQSDLLLLSVDPGSLGESLKWEVSRGDDLFPHLFAPLPVASVSRVDALPLSSTGQHQFPSDLGIST